MQKITQYYTLEGFYDADVDITKEEWLGIVSDPEIQEKTFVDVLIKFLREPGHKATCNALGKKYDCSFNYFNVNVTNFGKHVKNKLNRFYLEGTEGTETFWNIPMIGRSTKNGFEWTLRKELADALQEYLINDLIARYKKFVMSPASEFPEEKYKWELLTETKDMDVKDILVAITKSEMNLIDMSRAGFAIKQMLTENPIELESSFSELLNSERSFAENYAAFAGIIKPVAENKFDFAFPDVRTAAAFLTCARPDAYTFYMDKIYRKYCHYLGEETISAENKYMHYLKLVSRLAQTANKDKELRDYLMKETKGQLWSDLLVGQDVLWEMQERMIVDLSKVQEEENEYEPYTKEDFLRDVFMDESAYERLVSILRIKKNLILKGAPGVGKTYAAKRLAYSIMGERNTERVKFVQFHQSYSYEDFVMGYRPNDSGGFVLRPGVFYQFCKKAELDPDHDYYFIIDEINRGNLSKVFGEVFVLIEADLREEEVRLAYREEMFSVPKNLYIIGMLNTADRSLSMIDYALRRRFSFVEIEPALDKLIKALNIDPKSKLGKLLEEVKNLNDDIKDDPSLGSGFRIGHSYFCNSEAVSDSNIFNVVKYRNYPDAGGVLV